MIGFKHLNIIRVLLLMVVIHGGFFAYAENDPGQELKNKAVELFNRGRYQEAIPLFSKLVYDYPYDYQVKYYLGATLVETGIYSKEAEKNLLLASGNNVPVMVWFYLGRFYHATENWNSAQRFYNRFKNNADSAGADTLRIDELILLCYDHVNPFQSNSNPMPSDRVRDESVDRPVKENTKIWPADVKNVETQLVLPQIEKDTVVAHPPVATETTGPQRKGNAMDAVEVDADTMKASQGIGTSIPLPVTTLVGTESGPADQADVQEQATLPAITGTRPESSEDRLSIPEFISFRINERVTYLVEDMFQEKEALQEYKAGKQKSALLDTLVADLESLREQYHMTLDPSGRDTLGQKILRMESGMVTLKQEVGNHFIRALEIENNWWKNAGFNVYRSYIQVRDSLLQLRSEIIRPASSKETADTLLTIAKTTADTLQVPDPGHVAPESAKQQDDEITYRVQLGICGKNVSSQKKKLMDKISKIRPVESYANEQGNTICTTGNLTSYEDAMVLQNQVRLEGIRDAFVIAWKNGKRIPLPPENLRKP